MRRVFLILAVLVFTGPARADTLQAPRLGAASNFGQGWQPDLLDAAQALGIRDLRDAVYWDLVETGGRDRFQGFRTLYPELLRARGMGMSLTVNNGHPDHDGDVTPHTGAGVAAFARFAAAAVTRLGAIDAVEVGNEMNSAAFTSGPMRDADLGQRARLYTALLRATHDAAKAARPDLRILGGAAHSIPLAWFRALEEAGAPAFMDAVVIHPYTTPPEQLRRQVALLRALPGFAAMPIEVTEFGSEDAASAPAYLLKQYCQMALSGVTRAVWYPLNDRGDGLEPLIDAAGQVTAVGRTHRLIRDRLQGQPVTDAAPDPFTYACRFGARALVIWGAERAVTLGHPGLVALDANGAPLPAPRLSRDAPLLILSDGPDVVLGDTVILGPQTVLADSFDQFAYPGRDAGGFDRFARIGAQDIAMELRPGQERGGVPWTPWLGIAGDGMLRLGADWMLPSLADGRATEIVHRYTAPRDMTVTLEAALAPAARSSDGVRVTLTLDGALLESRGVTAPQTIRLGALRLGAGQVLDIAVAPGASARGDVTGYRFTLRAPG